MLLPAINALRESARRTQCINHVSQLISAVHSHEMAYGVYPPGVRDRSGPILNQEQGLHQGWLIPLLPYLEESNLYATIDPEVSVYHKNNQQARYANVTIFNCPSSPMWIGKSGVATSSYAAVHHDVEAPIDSNNQGSFFLNSRLTHDEISDGTRYTLFIGEKIVEENDDLGWMSGTRATLRNTGTPIGVTGRPENRTPRPIPAPPAASPPEIVEEEEEGQNTEVTEAAEVERDADLSTTAAAEAAAPVEQGTATTDPIQELRKRGLYVGGFASHHLGGAVFAFGDGHIAFLPDSIDPVLYQRLGNRADGQVVDTSSIEP